MSTVKTNATTSKKENLPKPPSDKKKEGKTWVQKRVDNAMRALRALTTLKERFDAGTRTEHRPDYAAHVRDVGQQVTDALGGIESAVKRLIGLGNQGYKPENEKVTIEAGVEVWLRPPVWCNKYHGLYSPEEMAGLTIKSMHGKTARARSDSGIEVVEPIGSFRTRPVDYAQAVAEREAAA